MKYNFNFVNYFKKFNFVSLILVLLSLFFVLFKGLQNTNIYTPQVDVKKDIPYFEAKIFDSDIGKYK